MDKKWRVSRLNLELPRLNSQDSACNRTLYDADSDSLWSDVDVAFSASQLRAQLLNYCETTAECEQTTAIAAKVKAFLQLSNFSSLSLVEAVAAACAYLPGVMRNSELCRSVSTLLRVRLTGKGLLGLHALSEEEDETLFSRILPFLQRCDSLPPTYRYDEELHSALMILCIGDQPGDGMLPGNALRVECFGQAVVRPECLAVAVRLSLLGSVELQLHAWKDLVSLVARNYKNCSRILELEGCFSWLATALSLVPAATESRAALQQSLYTYVLTFYTTLLSRCFTSPTVGRIDQQLSRLRQQLTLQSGWHEGAASVIRALYSALFHKLASGTTASSSGSAHFLTSVHLLTCSWAQFVMYTPLSCDGIEQAGQVTLTPLLGHNQSLSQPIAPEIGSCLPCFAGSGASSVALHRGGDGTWADSEVAQRIQRSMVAVADRLTPAATSKHNVAHAPVSRLLDACIARCILVAQLTTTISDQHMQTGVIVQALLANINRPTGFKSSSAGVVPRAAKAAAVSIDKRQQQVQWFTAERAKAATRRSSGLLASLLRTTLRRTPAGAAVKLKPKLPGDFDGPSPAATPSSTPAAEQLQGLASTAAEAATADVQSTLVDPAPTSLVCAGCRLPIGDHANDHHHPSGSTSVPSSAALILLGDSLVYHVGHCACTLCGQSTTEPLLHHGRPVCRRCNDINAADLCGACQRHVTPKDGVSGEIAAALGRALHAGCLSCAHCGIALRDGAAFTVHTDCTGTPQPYCVADYELLYGVRCSGCQRNLQPGGTAVEACGGVFHPSCFTCAHPGCGVNLSSRGEYYTADSGRPLCYDHYLARTGTPCAGCGAYVLGEGIEALASCWHVGCLACAACSQPLGLEDKVEVYQGAVYHAGGSCDPCNRLLSNDVSCASCAQPIHGDVLHLDFGAGPVQYHPECVRCCVCHAQLAAGEVYLAEAQQTGAGQEAASLYCAEHAAASNEVRFSSCSQPINSNSSV